MMGRLRLAAILLLVSGCSPTPQPIASKKVMEQPPVSRQARPVSNVSHPKEEFVYPFPTRTNPFTPPPQFASKQGRQVRSADRQSGLEVRGFVDVGRLRVVLVDNGHTYVLAEGETRRHLHVERIQPPKATVIRDGERMSVEFSRP